jgi:hypothetical protein
MRSRVRISLTRLTEQRHRVTIARASGASVEPTVDAAFVERVRARLRQLLGAWRATPFRGTLELDWPPRGEPYVRPR